MNPDRSLRNPRLDVPPPGKPYIPRAIWDELSPENKLLTAIHGQMPEPQSRWDRLLKKLRELTPLIVFEVQVNPIHWSLKPEYERELKLDWDPTDTALYAHSRRITWLAFSLEVY